MSKKKKKYNQENNTSVEEVKIDQKEEQVTEKNDEKLVYEEVKKEPKKKENTGFMNFTLIILLICSLVYLVMNLFYGYGDEAILSLISSGILLLFTSLFVCIGFSIGRRKKSLVILGSLLLIGYFGYNIVTDCFINGGDRVLNFQNMSLTEVMEWSEERNIELIQDYEYSDMIEEYHIISQDVLAGTLVKDVDTLTVAVSEGPSPYKEITIPNMIGWDSDSVLEFIMENHLSNVEVEWIESDQKQDTVIEQNTVGTLLRNEKLKLVFSAGEVIETSEVKLIDFTGMSEIEIVFYLEKNHIKYEFDYDFSSKIKKGYGIGQSVESGTLINTSEVKVVVTLSKGQEVTIAELKGMSMSEVTEWIISNKLKLQFKEAYDESTKENYVISCDYAAGDKVAEGTVITVTISKGQLKMPEFEDLNAFRIWASTYSINYQEVYEFSETVGQGEVISYSHNAGDVIKNNDTVIVTVSNGKKISVPNVVGLSKAEATSKLKSAGLGYNFVYSYSSSVAEGYVIKQSMSSGSEVAAGTTVTVTLSKGKQPTSSSGSSGSTTSCDTSKGSELNIQGGSSGSQTKSMITQLNPNHKFSFTFVSACPNGDANPGAICSGNLDGVWKNYCDTIYITVVQ